MVAGQLLRPSSLDAKLCVVIAALVLAGEYVPEWGSACCRLLQGLLLK
jgi:hypothetical protein